MNNRCADRRGTVQLESLRSEDNEKIWKERKMEETRNEVMQEVAEVQQDSYKSGSVQYIDSREVAEIVEKEHKNLIRDIKRYDKELVQLNFEPNEFFIESSYNDSIGRTLPCYLVTRKGCEFIAHKLTGIKGTKFTATYINRFHEMEDTLNIQIIPVLQQFMEQQTEASRLQMEFNQTVMERLEKLEKGKAGYKDNPFCVVEESSIESRKKEIYDLTSKVAELCGNSQTRILHHMYRALEENLGIVLDSFKSVYRSETGRQDAGMVEVIAANDYIYEKAVEMNKFVIERKQIYG